MNQSKLKNCFLIFKICSFMIVFLCLYSFAESPFHSEIKNRNNIGTITQYAHKIIGLIDPELGKALRIYLNITQPKSYDGDDNVGGDNQGVRSHFFEKIKNNSCLESLLSTFYKDKDVSDSS